MDKYPTLCSMQILTKTLAAVAIAIGACGITACSPTSSSHSCVNDTCNVTLKGDGASTELGPRDRIIELVSASSGTATFTVDGSRLSCAEDEAVHYGQVEIVCTDIGDSELKLRVIGLT